MLQPRRPLLGLLARCARAFRLGPRPPPSASPNGGEAGRRGLLGLLARQCGCVSGQRARRARRAWQLGGGGGSGAEGARRGGGGGGGGGGWGEWWWWRGGPFRGRPALAAAAGRLMATLAGVFVWDGQRIEEEELQRSAQEMQRMQNLAVPLQGGGALGEPPLLDPPSERDAASAPGEQPWEMVMDKKQFKLWRRPIEGTHLYQYRVFGTYTDVTPRQFFNVQLDTEYRKKWDSLVIKLDVIERDAATGSEVIHWVTHFPVSLAPRPGAPVGLNPLPPPPPHK
ncbi:LOW QUALITY PROTEIN: stAR-related lipid transfer protein 7, mitochondrial, partial [Tympanuchus pallidicinctus]|uniref:LOW QUALITY PROTEIN: stAR-related lipid transfer protein 7, mitochondrial n=1 Tax=Tympanuchus pallidicinctus TaxID=109042 RepID=UPI0022876E41